jgi:hypothetical protein
MPVTRECTVVPRFDQGRAIPPSGPSLRPPPYRSDCDLRGRRDADALPRLRLSDRSRGLQPTTGSYGRERGGNVRSLP